MIESILTLITPTTFLVFIVVLLLTYYVMKMPRSLNMPPGPFPLPVLGNFLEMRKTPGKGDIHIFQTLFKKYGKLFSLKIGSNYIVVISDYDLLMEAFVKRSNVFTNRPLDIMYTMKYLNKRLGAGVITNNGHSWKHLRRTALMTMRDFGVGKHSLEEKIQEEISILLDCFSQQKGKPVLAKSLFSMATSNVICGIIFGSRFDYTDPTFKELLRVLDISLRSNPLFLPINFFSILKHIPYFSQTVESFTKTMKLTTQFVKDLSASNESTYDKDNVRHFVDLFIKMRRENQGDDTFDERGMSRVIVDLFTAGSDTTANVLSWSMLYMAKYPDVQRRCQREIDEVLGKGKQACLADKDKLPYVEATILEVLRLKLAAPIGLPHCTSEDIEFHGYHIPKNTTVFGNLIDINLDPKTFPNPENFDPEHFLDANGKIVHRERMVSFSVGPRSCLGEILAKMELSLFFTSILQFYTISPEPGKPIDLSSNVSVILRHLPQNVVLTRRE